MEPSESRTTLKPPYGNVTWYKKLFDLIRSRSFERFDKEIIEMNIVKRANATMLFNGLRFLGLVKEDGTVTDKFESLRRKGEEFKQNLEKVVREGYSHLFSTVVVEKAKPEHLFNYLAEYYDYGEATAKLSTKIFVYLCQEAGILLSPELSEMISKPKKVTRRRRKGKTEEEEAMGEMPIAPKGMHMIRWGDSILIYLRKGDKSTREGIAKTAKRFIDIYVEEEESETKE